MVGAKQVPILEHSVGGETKYMPESLVYCKMNTVFVLLPLFTFLSLFCSIVALQDIVKHVDANFGDKKHSFAAQSSNDALKNWLDQTAEVRSKLTLPR